MFTEKLMFNQYVWLPQHLAQSGRIECAECVRYPLSNVGTLINALECSIYTALQMVLLVLLFVMHDMPYC